MKRHPRRQKSRPPCPTQRQTTVCVVDPKVDDYRAWQAMAQQRGMRLKIFATAAEALRFARSHVVDLWAVSAALAGLSGYELCSMLKRQSTRAAVCLLADEYSVEAERAAWQARATWFGCKPAHVDWLAQWLPLAPAKARIPGFSFSH